jgi:hypothetical protein
LSHHPFLLMTDPSVKNRQERFPRKMEAGASG